MNFRPLDRLMITYQTEYVTNVKQKHFIELEYIDMLGLLIELRFYFAQTVTKHCIWTRRRQAGSISEL